MIKLRMECGILLHMPADLLLSSFILILYNIAQIKNDQIKNDQSRNDQNNNDQNK